MHQETLATELLRELKASARRWFIAFCAMVGLELGTIAGFLWYISLPVEESTTYVEQSTGHTEGSATQQIIGGDAYGKTEGENSSEETGFQEEEVNAQE